MAPSMKFTFALMLFLLCGCSPSRQSKSDDDAVIEAVLAYPSVAQYIHPDIPGRLPVKVALTPAGTATLRATAFNRRVVSTSPSDPQAMILGVSVKDSEATVTLEYRQEGVTGLIHLMKVNGNWIVAVAQMAERRSNNSFKPRPLHGLARVSLAGCGPA